MPIICAKCNKQFSTQSSHNRHVREVHKDSPDPVPYETNAVWNNRCLEESCECAFRCNKDLVNHLQKVHQIDSFETEFHCFNNMSDFENWKSTTERLNNCSYIFKSKHSSSAREIIYYKCNRSKTNYIAKAQKKKRSPKSQGSCKMNVLCTSEIKVIIENGEILVEYQKFHYGHRLEIQHIRLSKLEKQNIASKLASGMTPQRILQSARNNIESSKRISLLTMKDLRNIKKSFGIEMGKAKGDSDQAFEKSNAQPISEESLALSEEDSNKTNTIIKIKELYSKMESLDFQGLDDSVINQIHHHLSLINKLSTGSAVSGQINGNFKMKSKPQQKRAGEPQLRFITIKKKCVEAEKSPKKASLQVVVNIGENL